MKHAVSTWMPMHWTDFWDSEAVSVMSNDAALLYLWLLKRQWEYESLPADPAALKALCPGRFHACFAAAWPQVEACFEAGEDGRLRNPRCAAELAQATARNVKAAERARLGGLGKAANACKESASSRPQADAKQTASVLGAASGSGSGSGSGHTDPDSVATQRASAPPPLVEDPPPKRKTRKPRKPRKPKPPPDPEAAPNPDHQPLIAHFCDAYQRVYGKKYPFGGRDAAAVAKLLDVASLEDAKAAVDAALGDPWWVERGLTLAKVERDYATFAGLAAKPRTAKLTQGDLNVQGTLRIADQLDAIEAAAKARKAGVA